VFLGLDESQGINRNRKDVMPRFKVNRWWTLILTLCLGCAAIAVLSSRASAQARMFDELGQKDWSGGNGGPPPGEGDPDTPIPSSAKRAQPLAGMRPAANVSMSRVAGDGARVDGVMMWNFRVVLQGLRFWGFRSF
jgi:hypothetical protein